METRVMTAHIPQSLAEKVDELAAQLEKSRGWIIRQALTDWIAREEERDQLTRKAMASADAGLLIEHDAVQAWAESLSTDNPLPIPRP